MYTVVLQLLIARIGCVVQLRVCTQCCSQSFGSSAPKKLRFCSSAANMADDSSASPARNAAPVSPGDATAEESAVVVASDKVLCNEHGAEVVLLHGACSGGGFVQA
jgi:hypothetical protein